VAGILRVTIINDAELEVVRRQVGRVEAALESLRQEVKPKGEAMYHLMAESYLDLLKSLSADVDAYLGSRQSSKPTSPLR
jgi:hypothetical protein